MVTRHTPHRLYNLRSDLVCALLSMLLVSLGVLSCQESSVSCLSDRQCDSESVCVAGQCLGAELQDRDPYDYYREEMHFRLAAECGICHAASEESVLPPPVSSEDEDQNIDPYKLPTYTAAAGDSGWRIFIDDLTEETLRASYLDTMQYINLTSPEESLLFAFGRGDVGISQSARHPKLYTTRAERDALLTPSPLDDSAPDNEEEESMKGSELTSAPIGYERLVNWARLPHSDPALITYNLEAYRNGPQQALGLCSGCHSGDPILSAVVSEDEFIPRGGFAFKVMADDPADLAPLTALINLDDPANSALIRLYIGEYDHTNNALSDESNLDSLREALVPWIEQMR